MTGAGILAASLAAGIVLSSAGLASAAQHSRRRAHTLGRLDPAAPTMAAAVRATAPAPSKLVSALEAAGIDADPARCWWAWRWSVVAAVAVGGALGGPGAALLALVTTAGGPAVLLAALRGRGATLLEVSLAGLLEEAARAMQAGASLRQATAVAASAGSGPIAADLAQAMTNVDKGANFSAEVARWGRRRSTPSIGLVVAAITMAAETGGTQGRALDRVAGTIRDRLGVRSEQAALASQARASALVMGVMPVGFAVLAGITDPRTAHFLLRRTPGLACLTLGLALDAAALVWMLRITGSAP